MLLMEEKDIRGAIYHAIYRYMKTYNKYMKSYDKSEEPPYLTYWDINNLYGQAMSQKLPVNDFKWVEKTSQFNKDFIKNYNEDSDIGYLLQLMFIIIKIYITFTMIYTFFPERMKIEKIEKLVTNLHDKEEYVIHIRNLKQVLNHGLVLKKCIESLNLIKKLG